MKKLTKFALIFVFALVIGISGIVIAGNINEKKDEDSVSSLAAGPTVAYTDANTWNSHKAASYSGGGDGTSAATAYQIGSAAELALMAYNVNNNVGNAATAYYKLTSDIDLSAHYWIPIGNYRAAVTGVNLANRTFNGNFDGQEEYKIKGLYIGNPDAPSPVNANLQYAGLFGYLNGAKISNVNVECYIQNSNTGTVYIGGIAGYGNNIINLNNCIVFGKINVTLSGTNYIGGIISFNNGTISIIGCANFTNLSSVGTTGTSTNRVGGLIANSNNATIRNSYNVGNITFRNSLSLGGIVADPYTGVIIDSCFNAGDITVEPSISTYSDTGGIIGWARSSFSLLNSYNIGNITINSSSYLSTGYGGLVGWGSTGSISNCFAAGDLIAKNTTIVDNIGFLVGGYANYITFSNCYYSTSAESKYNNGNSDITSITGGNNGSGVATTIGFSKEQLSSQSFVDLLNLNRGSGLEWMFTGDFPTFVEDIRYSLAITFVYNNGTSGQIKVYQSLSGNCSLPIPPVYEDYSFIGWFENIDGTGFEITSGTTVEELISTGITTFHAAWQSSEVSYLYTVVLYDQYNNQPITNQTTIDQLISATSVTLDENDYISAAIQVLATTVSEYRFLYFKINGVTINSLAGYIASDFAINQVNGEEITIEAYFIPRYNLAFILSQNPTIVDNALVYVTIEEGNNIYEIRGFFQGRKFDAGSKVKIDIITAPDKAVQSISTGSNFILESNTNIVIVIGVGSLTLNFAIDSGIPENLMPKLLSGNTSFSAGAPTNETIIVEPSNIYKLTGYVYYLNGVNPTALPYTSEINGYVKNLDLLTLIGGTPGVTSITIKAVYERIVSLSFSYVDSSELMGAVEVYKGNNKIELDEFGKDKNDTLKDGDLITIKLISKTGYQAVDFNGFTNGQKTLNVDGQMKIDIKFIPTVFKLDSSPNATLSKEEASIDERIVINLSIGFGSELTDYTLKIGEKVIDKEFIEVSGNSLIINLNENFIKTYGVTTQNMFNVEFGTKLSTLFIVGIGGSTAILIVAAILIVVYIIALKKRKAQLAKAELETRMGHSRLSVSDTIKQMREQD